MLVAALQLHAQNICEHKVVKGETLYGISKKYNSKPRALQKLNDGLTNALSLGQIIKVPCVEGTGIAKAGVVKAAVDTVKKVVPVVKEDAKQLHEQDEFKGNYIFHTVKKGETIYGITTKFAVDDKKFLDDNPEIVEAGLKVGAVVKIFQKDTTSEDAHLIERHFLKGKLKAELNRFSPNKKMLDDSAVVNIAVMLPFMYAENVAFLKKFKDEQEPQLFPKTRIFIELYQGIKMAVDSCVKAGLNVQLFAFDTKADTNEIKKIIAQPVFNNIDLIIGPGYTNTFVFTANYFKNSGIPIISPFSKKELVIKGFPNAVRIVPSNKMHFKAIGQYVGETYASANVIIAVESKKYEELAKVAQREIIAETLLKDSTKTVMPKIVTGIYQPIEHLKVGKKNIIILGTNTEAFASKIAAKLITQTSKYDISMFGLDDLKDYKNIEVEYWDSLNIHISSSQEVKYNYPLADKFIKKYYKTYYCEPSEYAFTGYDFTMILLTELLYDQKYNHNKLVGNFFMGSLRDYEFKYNGPSNGISNNLVYVYKYDNYKFIKLND